MSFLESRFKLKELGTSVRTEVLAACTTFMAMTFIFVVNPITLQEAGIPFSAAFAATIWASILPTLIMAFAANLPVVLAPGMGVNAFFTYTLVFGMGLSWQSALAAVFLSGLIFLVLSIFGVPSLFVRVIPSSLKAAIGAGIGFFLVFIGFQSAGISVANPETMIGLGNLASPQCLLAILGLLISAVLMIRKVRGSLLIGILVVTLLGMLFGVSPAPSGIDDIVSLDIPLPLFAQFDFSLVLSVSFISVLFSMTMVDMFNAMGTFIGLSTYPTMSRTLPDGSTQIRGLKAAMIADSSGTLMGGLLGTSPVTSYLESVTGIAEGGRSGLCALVCAVLFFLCLFFAPLVSFIPAYATSAALILVGVFMIQDLKHIDFSDMSEALPAMLTMISMPLTYSLVTGFGLGFISYVLIKVCSGKRQDVSWTLVLLAFCFLINFIVGNG